MHLKLEMGTFDFFRFILVVFFIRSKNWFRSFSKLLLIFHHILFFFSLNDHSVKSFVQYNWLFNETVHSVTKDIFFESVRKNSLFSKKCHFLFCFKTRSFSEIFPNLSYSVKFVQTIFKSFFVFIKRFFLFVRSSFFFDRHPFQKTMPISGWKNTIYFFLPNVKDVKDDGLFLIYLKNHAIIVAHFTYKMFDIYIEQILRHLIDD